MVYFGSMDNRVYALSASTGSLIWSYLTGNDTDSSPVVVGGVVYIGSLDGNVYALNAVNGSLLWNYTTGSVGRIVSGRRRRGGLCRIDGQ